VVSASLAGGVTVSLRAGARRRARMFKTTSALTAPPASASSQGQGDGVEALGQDRCQNGDELPVRLVTAPEPAADPCQRRWTPPTSPSRSVNDSKEGSPMAMELLAIDLGKQSFHLHGIDADGVVVSRRVSRTKLEQVVHELAPKIVAMEACASSHDWGRRFERDFLQVRLINPRFVKPFVRGSKNDTADAEAIFEAASRPTMFP
jgi:hypothetical protein